jgi:hypothetical protein
MALTAAERTLHARIAAETRWANTVDRLAATQPGRDAANRKFEADIVARVGETAWHSLTPELQAKMIKSARSAHMSRVALAASRLARVARRELQELARAVEAAA